MDVAHIMYTYNIMYIIILCNLQYCMHISVFGSLMRENHVKTVFQIIILVYTIITSYNK